MGARRKKVKLFAKYLTKGRMQTMVTKARKHNETELDKNTRVLEIIVLLEREHLDAKIALNYTTPLELLIATILSAQCTDKGVNIVTSARAREIAEKGNHDLIVLGSRGLGAVKRFLLGSVSDDVNLKAKCSVLLVPTKGN